MPIPLIYAIPFVTGALGFGAGFWSGSSMTKLVKLAAVGGGCYLTYKLVEGAK